MGKEFKHSFYSLVQMRSFRTGKPLSIFLVSVPHFFRALGIILCCTKALCFQNLSEKKKATTF